MGKPQRRFGKEFEAEAVRLVEVSGRTQRAIAMDLGVGLSTLRRWLDKISFSRRNRFSSAARSSCRSGGGASISCSRRLRQEREILKRAATFFAKEGSR